MVRTLLYDKVFSYDTRTKAEQHTLDRSITQLLATGERVIARNAYSFDDRITDNAWIEVCTVYLFVSSLFLLIF